ncbi:universal stress protein [Mycolicibacterium sp.]|uniref:universal stress protein n=1 Tax=Mycolicibacterium sp. TaxID=2320850 RepID=UPI001A213A62|nr:universal stress protein [Mycolicibacterium sp.]MBJ7338132.1 universal stress protein [Mycolicibacterium sp.]
MSDNKSERIIVGVDGSTASDAAIRWAAGEAAMRKVDLTLLHVVNPVPGLGVGYSMAPLPADFGRLQEEEAQRVLESARRVVKAAIPPGGNIDVHSELVIANPVPTLIDVSKDAQMIVVGCRGYGAWRRGLFGSISTGLVHHAHCPVAVIHDPADGGPTGRRGPVVLGVDGSPASELAIAIAFGEACSRGVELVAIHAWLDTEPSYISRSTWPDFEAQAAEVLSERLSGWSDRYPDVVVNRRVVLNQPARHLLEAAESAQLVVVGSHGRGGFAGMVLGSVSTAVVHAARTPVIVARRG